MNDTTQPEMTRHEEQESLNVLDRSQPIALRAELIRAHECHCDQVMGLDETMRLGVMVEDFDPFPHTDWGIDFALRARDVVLFAHDPANPDGVFSVYGVRSGNLMAVPVDRVTAL